ncbi:hypothetical protein RclHR1_17500003 [Rhizophagus clarus]|uniref:F-box domain-containing protein n=1 Tax=Rhizophagus clarus TaxID=94130 RepID=A0A2Z6QKF7_9GLOM|nr:hypothetical protein RclHR1_17500003 [Rhizophagus clarus]GES91606.1 hypothetical protein GLOIN_2v1878600 [Rhizophagus clarus]
MTQLVPDVLLLIFAELQDDPSSLYSCLLVNRSWCHLAVRILWRYFSREYQDPVSYKKVSLKRLFSTILLKEPILLENGTKLPSSKPLFNYLNFFTHISSTFVNDMVQTLIEEEDTKDLLEKEVYKIIFKNCNNVKKFHVNTKCLLCSFPNAKPFFSNLNSLEINLTLMNSTMLNELAFICNNISNLEIKLCNNNHNQSLVHFINAQTKLQSLCLNFGNRIERCMSLSNAIGEKATTLEKLTIKSSIRSISPKFLPSLKNLRYLIINNNDDSKFLKNNIRKEWEHYLSIAANLPKLEYFEVSNLEGKTVTLLIEKYIDTFSSISTTDDHKLIFQKYL